ncbi:hypothetical protein ACFL1R_06355 [Candidatus Latescibacterota bacterium]
MPHSSCQPVHTFHIPVMGTGFTIDTPIHVAQYGISSVISLVDDVLIEQMRKHHTGRAGEEYHEIRDGDPDSRARRITEYLNLIDRIVKKQVDAVRKAPFETGSVITRYFEMLPDGELKHNYLTMLSTGNPEDKARMQDNLRNCIVPGSIDVNIMTKLDCDHYQNGEKLPSEYSDAKSALRGFANSSLNSSIVCSAGMNRGFYAYMANFDDFYPGADGLLKKKIVLKVSDYRSAEVQGAFLAKRCLWVSEYRIESGLNCGGHAFATKGLLLGPIMDKFREKRHVLIDKLFGMYTAALQKIGRPDVSAPFDTKITVQGGIGSASENESLFKYYHVDGTGWCTPFLLVPEVVNVDEIHLRKIAEAGPDNVYLSASSPMGIPFWNLRNSASEEIRRKHIREGRPGSICRKSYLKLDTEITDLPVCRASAAYQRRRLNLLENENLTPEQYRVKKENILNKSCICHDLAGGATIRYGIDPDANTAVCCGPNIANFSKIASLQEMVDHIYGRTSLLSNKNRQHMFINELMIYIDYLRNEYEVSSADMTQRTMDYLTEFKGNLLNGIEYYKVFADDYIETKKEAFLEELNELKIELETIQLEPAV